MHKIDPSQFMLSRDKGLSQPATSTIRSLQLSLRDVQSSPRSPEPGFPGSGHNSFRGQDLQTTSFGRWVIHCGLFNIKVLLFHFSYLTVEFVIGLCELVNIELHHYLIRGSKVG